MTKGYFFLMLHICCEVLGLCSWKPGNQSSCDLERFGGWPRGTEVMAKHLLAFTGIQVERPCLTSGGEGKLVLVNNTADYHRLH